MIASRWDWHYHTDTKLVDVYEVSSGTIYATGVRLRDVPSVKLELERQYPAVASGVAPALSAADMRKSYVRRERQKEAW